LDEGHVNIASKCGTSVIDLDFWGALPAAFHYDIDFLGKEVPIVDFRGPNGGEDDERPLAASWTYNLNDSAIGPAALDIVHEQWVSYPPNSNWRYACAAPLTELDTAFHGFYEWEITPQSGPWSGGEAACQKLGSQYHFWFPESVYEQSNLLRYFIFHDGEPAGAVWLNYRSATATHSLVAAPGALALKLTVNEQPQTQTIQIGGGNGTQLKVLPGTLFDAKLILDDGWPTNTIAITPISRATHAPGKFNDEITVEEIDPETHQYDAKIEIPISLTVTDALIVSTSNLSFNGGSEVKVIAVAPGTAGDSVPFVIKGVPSWLKVEPSENAAPAQLNVMTVPQKTGTYVGTFDIVPAGPYQGGPAVPVTVTYTQP
jgi:hypothetical protein